MRLLDYRNYTAHVDDHWVFYEAPMRDKPSANRTERLYQRLVRPMPGLGEADRGVWRYAFIYPNTAIDLYPDGVGIWRIGPDGVAATRELYSLLRPAHHTARDRLVAKLNDGVNTEVAREDLDLVTGVQRGLATRGYELGPLSDREAAVAWLARRLREDLGEAA
jgi:Rieske 2Fe-2S family protein